MDPYCDFHFTWRTFDDPRFFGATASLGVSFVLLLQPSDPCRSVAVRGLVSMFFVYHAGGNPFFASACGESFPTKSLGATSTVRGAGTPGELEFGAC